MWFEFGLGLAGGFAVETMKWFRIREQLHEGLPEYATSWPYWAATGVMIGLGGVLALAYQASEDVQLSPILAINIGVSAPLLLSTLAQQVPRGEPGSVD